jgi:cytochrome c553
MMISSRFLRSLGGMLALVAASASPTSAADGIEAKLQICGSCHGTDGRPGDPTIPIIWGQQQAYLEKQLKDYKSGERDSQIMSSLAESLKNEELPQVAAVFAGKNWPHPSDGGAAKSPPDIILACQTCHQANFLGGVAAGETAPRLAGQTREYLVDAMRSFADGERDNNAAMSALMKGLSTTDLEAIARYLSSL